MTPPRYVIDTEAAKSRERALRYLARIAAALEKQTLLSLQMLNTLEAQRELIARRTR